MMTRACTLRAALPAWRTLRRSCEAPMVCLDCKSWEHILLPVAAHHRPASAHLGTYCRAYLLNKLHIASEMERPTCTVGERKKTRLLKAGSWRLSRSAPVLGSGDVASRRHCYYCCHYDCHCYYHCRFTLHIEKRVLIF